MPFKKCKTIWSANQVAKYRKNELRMIFLYCWNIHLFSLLLYNTYIVALVLHLGLQSLKCLLSVLSQKMFTDPWSRVFQYFYTGYYKSYSIFSRQNKLTFLLAQKIFKVSRRAYLWWFWVPFFNLQFSTHKKKYWLLLLCKQNRSWHYE